MRTFLSFCIVLLAFINFTDLSYEAMEMGPIKFKVTGRSLHSLIIYPDDPYYIVSLSDDGGNTRTVIERSEIIPSQLNPDWNCEFEISFNRSKSQYLYFHVYDNDKLKPDDSLLHVWMNIDDFVDKGELAYLKMDKEE